MPTIIITARRGRGKNLWPVLGKPIIAYPIAAAIGVGVPVYVSTDCSRIAEVALRMGARVLPRPEHLATDTAEHADVIEHCVDALNLPDEEAVCVLLGNTTMIDSSLIIHSLDLIGPDCDSVCSVWRAQDDHPRRALSLSDDGYLTSDNPAGACRQQYEPVYFYDQGVWTFLAGSARARKGPAPWVWLGTQCRPIVREWLTGRDIHGDLDIAAQEWWVDGRFSAKK